MIKDLLHRTLILFVWITLLFFLGVLEVLINQRLPFNLQLIEIGEKSEFGYLNQNQFLSLKIISLLLIIGIIFIFLKIPKKIILNFDKLLTSKLILSLFTIFLLSLQIYFYWGQITDDRYINSRIAKNISESFLPVVNFGDTSTPATSFVMPYIYAIFINFSDYIAPALISLLLYSGLIFYIIWNSKLELFKIFLVLSLVFYPSVIYWSIAGMETGLVMATVGYTALLLKRKKQTWITYFLIGCLVWVRPELILFPIMLSSQLLYRLIKKIIKSKTNLILIKNFFFNLNSLFLGTIIYTLIFFFNFYPILPTPFYFKGNFGNSIFRDSQTLFREGLFDFLTMMSSSILIMFFLFLLLKNNFIFYKKNYFKFYSFEKNQYLSLWPTIIVLSVVYASWGYNHMSFFYRYWAAVYVLIVIEIFYKNSELDLKKIIFNSKGVFEIKYNIILLQIITSLIIIVYTIHLSLGLGISNRRDWFSANDYTSFMRTNYEELQNTLREVTQSKDTVFTFGAIQAMNLEKNVFVYDIYYNPASITNNSTLSVCRKDFYNFKDFNFKNIFSITNLITNYPKSAQYPDAECLLKFDYLVIESQIPESVLPSFKKIAPNIFKNINSN